MYNPLANIYQRVSSLYRNFRTFFEPQEVILVSFIPPGEIYDAYKEVFKRKGVSREDWIKSFTVQGPPQSESGLEQKVSPK